MCERHYIWDAAACSCRNGNYLARIIDNSMITCGIMKQNISTFYYILTFCQLIWHYR